MEITARLSELNRTFRVPSGLGRSRPRPTTLTGSGWALVAVAVILVSGAIASGVLLAREARRQSARLQALIDTGAVTTGTVTRLWSNGDNRDRVAYSYVVNGVSYPSDRKVPRSRRAGMKIGDPIDVRYLLADPSIDEVNGHLPTNGIPAPLPWLVATGLLSLAAIFLFVIHRQRDLLTEGRPTPAVVTGVKKEGGPHGGHWSMTYAFPLMNGTMASGKSSTSKKGPAVGSVFCVIYDPERPKRNRAYPFSLVKPD